MGNIYNKAGDAQSIKFGAAQFIFGKPNGQTIVGYSDTGGELTFQGQGLIYQPVDAYFPVKVFPAGMMVKLSVNFAEWKAEQVALGLGMDRSGVIQSSSSGKQLHLLPLTAENLHHIVSGSEYWCKIIIPNEDNPLLSEEIFLAKVARDPESELTRGFRKEVATYDTTFVALQAENIALPNGGTIRYGLGYISDEKPMDASTFAAIVLPTSLYDFADTRVNEELYNTFIVQNNGSGDLIITGSALKTKLHKDTITAISFSTNTTITFVESGKTLNLYQNKKLLVNNKEYTIASSTASDGSNNVTITINTTDLTSEVFVGDTFYIADTAAYSAGDFELVSGYGTTNVAPGSQHSIVAKFTPQSAADDKVVLIQISSNDADDPEMVIEITGDGTAAGAGTGTIAFKYGGNVITTLNYGNVVRGSKATRTVQIHNTGTGLATISTVKLTTETVFRIKSGKTSNFTIAAGSYESLELEFSPTTIGSATDTLTITSDASNPSATLSLSGTGVNSSDNPSEA